LLHRVQCMANAMTFPSGKLICPLPFPPMLLPSSWARIMPISLRNSTSLRWYHYGTSMFLDRGSLLRISTRW